MAEYPSFAVVISLAKVHSDTSAVTCLSCLPHADVNNFHPYGFPFQLFRKGKEGVDNNCLREMGIKEGTVLEIKTLDTLVIRKTGFQLEVSEIMRHLKFNDDGEGVVAFRGIADAFPMSTKQESKEIYSKDDPLLPTRYTSALISVSSAVTQDERITALTRRNEEVNFKNRSLTCYKNTTNIEAFEVPIRQPVSDEDVGDVILISLVSKPEERYYTAVCEGILLSASSEPEAYKMESRPRGFCLIFNNMSFKDKKIDRHGANLDEEKLRDLFEKLHFEVRVFPNKEKREMEDICIHFGSKEDHRKYDAFVCIIMSHGKSGDQIMDVNERTIGIEDLMSEFNAVRCPSLENKPKIFVVQACRGPEKEVCLDPTDDRQIDYKFSDSTLSRSRVPKESDFLLAYGSVPGYVSYRMPNFGSFFIQTLVDVFEKKHDKDDLEDMLTEVRRRIAACQVSVHHTTLRYKVFL